MDRLTVRRSDGRFAIANKDGATPTEQTMKIPLVLSRLAAYEDTELEPEDLTRVFNEEAILKLAGQVLGATHRTVSVNWPRRTGRMDAECRRACACCTARRNLDP